MSIQFSGRVSNYDRAHGKFDPYHEYMEALMEMESGEDPPRDR